LFALAVAQFVMLYLYLANCWQVLAQMELATKSPFNYLVSLTAHYWMMPLMHSLRAMAQRYLKPLIV